MQVIKKQSVKKQNRRASLKVRNILFAFRQRGCLAAQSAGLPIAQQCQRVLCSLARSLAHIVCDADFHQDHELHTLDAYTLQPE